MEYRNLPGEHQSDLKYILKHPQKYLQQKQSEGGDEIWFTVGTIVEEMLLFPKKDLREDYYINKGVSASDTIKAIIEDVYNSLSFDDRSKDLGDLENLIIKAADKVEYYTNWKSETRYNKIVKEGNEYFKILKESEGKKVIESADWNKCLNAKVIVATDEFVKPILEDRDIIKKHVIQYILNGVEMVSEIDFMIKRDGAKTIQPYDFKTTSKPLYSFKNSFISYGYDFQDVIYQKGLQLIYPDYKILPVKFIVQELGSTNRPMIFQASDEIRQEAVDKVKDAIKRLKFHRENDKWEYPMEQYQNGVNIIE